MEGRKKKWKGNHMPLNGPSKHAGGKLTLVHLGCVGKRNINKQVRNRKLGGKNRIFAQVRLRPKKKRGEGRE